MCLYQQVTRFAVPDRKITISLHSQDRMYLGTYQRIITAVDQRDEIIGMYLNKTIFYLSYKVNFITYSKNYPGYYGLLYLKDTGEEIKINIVPTWDVSFG